MYLNSLYVSLDKSLVSIGSHREICHAPLWSCWGREVNHGGLPFNLIRMDFATQQHKYRCSSFLADESFQQESLTTHNTYRKMHQSPPLTLSTDLNKSAQSWANHLLASGIMQHSGSGGIGENLYCMSSSAPITLTGRVSVSVSALGRCK